MKNKLHGLLACRGIYKMRSEMVDLALEALQDYQKWFSDDDEHGQVMAKRIAAAIMDLESKEFGDYSFHIASLHRDDLVSHQNDNPMFLKDIDIESITDEQMAIIALKVGDDYCEQLFWDHLGSVARSVLERWEGS